MARPEKKGRADVNREDRAVEISTYFEQFISNQVATGRFANNAEVLQAGLRLLEEQTLQFQLQKTELGHKHDSETSSLDAFAREASELSQTASEAMRALASAASDGEQSMPIIPATKGLLRSRIAAE